MDSLKSLCPPTFLKSNPNEADDPTLSQSLTSEASRVSIRVSQLSLRLIFAILLSLAFANSGQVHGQQRTTVVIDADTGNEIDDPYAIARALIHPDWNIVALNATQWQTSLWSEPKSMENSHRVNQTLLGHMGIYVKTCRGGVARMFDWGDKAQHSAAAYEIIKQAKKMPEGEKLTVIALGALTNVASAIYIDPSIESKLSLYWLGTGYDFEKKILTITDFNCMMDIQALFIILKSKVEMHVVPKQTSVNMQLTFAETKEKLAGKNEVGDYLIDRWYRHLDGGRKKRAIWDLALIEAMIHPEWAEIETIKTSRDMGNREIHMYKSIDAEKMKADFYKKLAEFKAEKRSGD